MIRCCFARHRFASHSLLPEIMLAVEDIVRNSESVEFLSGGMGQYDKLCEQAVREIKKKYPEKEISLCLVLPSYRYAPGNDELRYMRNLFDDVFVCDASDGSHYKSMIGKRNCWMVEESDVMIAYVLHESGGAYTSLKFAQKKGLRIIRVRNMPIKEKSIIVPYIMLVRLIKNKILSMDSGC